MKILFYLGVDAIGAKEGGEGFDLHNKFEEEFRDLNRSLLGLFGRRRRALNFVESVEIKEVVETPLFKRAIDFIDSISSHEFVFLRDESAVVLLDFWEYVFGISGVDVAYIYSAFDFLPSDGVADGNQCLNILEYAFWLRCSLSVLALAENRSIHFFDVKSVGLNSKAYLRLCEFLRIKGLDGKKSEELVSRLLANEVKNLAKAVMPFDENNEAFSLPIEVHKNLKNRVEGEPVDYDLDNSPALKISHGLGFCKYFFHAMELMEGKIAEQVNLRQEYESIVMQNHAITSSLTWRLASPVRFFGYLYRGEFNVAKHVISDIFSRCFGLIPESLRKGYQNLLKKTGLSPDSTQNFPAINDIVRARCLDGINQKSKVYISDLPRIDISVVTYNSERWLKGFFDSLCSIDYPKHLISLFFVDNSSSDATCQVLSSYKDQLGEIGFGFDVSVRPNLGFGAGHNFAIAKGSAPFCLVTNVDLLFEPDCLKKIVSIASRDITRVAAWELRQKPYEHPKYYDPVTGITNWNAHACILLRRTAFESIGGYDESLFMYCEDVEISYRLRRAGYLIRYCPSATVWHFSYGEKNQLKPIQYLGSTFGNMYLRLKYGRPGDIAAIPLLAMRLIAAPESFPSSRKKIIKNIARLISIAPRAFMSRQKSDAYCPFRTWDYDMIREGAFYEFKKMPRDQPLVSVITRTYAGRELYLRQALMSVANQTWENLELIVVQDGGDSMKTVCDAVAEITDRKITFVANGKFGRSKAGNAGLDNACGKWCVFLDDDDLLFSDHIEVLANALIQDTNSVASYSLAWEVITDTQDYQKGIYVEKDHQIPAVLRQEFSYSVLQHHNYFPIQAVLFERALYQERGGFDEDMDALEDWTLWLRYAWNNRFAYVPKVTSLYRTPSDAEKIKERSNAFSAAYPIAVARAAAFAQTFGKTS